MVTRRGELAYFNGPTDDAERVEHLYLEQGFVQAKVKGPEWTVSDDGLQAEVALTIDEGEAFTLGRVTVSGIPSKVPELYLRTGERFNPERIRKALEVIQEGLRRVEGKPLQVTPSVQTDIEGRRVDIEFVIEAEKPAPDGTSAQPK
jgi:outer membrane protein insertion porin family